MNICETEALCESVFCKERRKEGWKNRKEKKRKKQGRNRGGKNYTPRNLMWLFFTLNLGSTYAYIRASCCPGVFKKNDENKWPESEDTDASSSLSWFQFTYTIFSGLTREQGQMGSNVPFSTKILWF